MPAGALPLDVIAGPEAIDLGLTAGPALEGPQVLLTWNRLYVSCTKFRIVQRLGHHPTTPDDGLTVYESAGFTDTVGVGVKLVHPARYYYYRAFCLIGAAWYEPENAFASSMSGAYPKLEPTGEEGLVGNGTHDEYGLLQQGNDWTYIEGLDVEAGDWLEFGEIQPVQVLVNKVDGNKVYFDPVEVTVDRELELPVLEGYPVTITRVTPAYSNAPTMQVAGVDLHATGYRARQFIKVSGSYRHDGLHLINNTIGDVIEFFGIVTHSIDYGPVPGSFNTTATDLPLFADDEPASTGVRIELAPGKGPGTKVKKLRQVNTWLADQVYKEYLPPEVADDDEATGQGELLETTQLDDGSYAALGEPGLQWGLQRWLRVLTAEYAKAHAASNMFSGLTDLTTAPLPFLSRFARYFGYEYNRDDEGASQRAQVLVQPRLLQLRGRNNTFALYLRRQTGATPTFLYGRDRVLRLNDFDTGVSIQQFTFNSTTDVNAGTDVVTVTDHGLATATAVRYLRNGGVYDTGLTNGGVYYVRAVSSSTLAFYTSASNANSDTSRVALTAQGGETHLLVVGDIRLQGTSGVVDALVGVIDSSSFVMGEGTYVYVRSLTTLPSTTMDWGENPDWFVGLTANSIGTSTAVIGVGSNYVLLGPVDFDNSGDFAAGDPLELYGEYSPLDDVRKSLCSYDTDCVFNDKGLMVFLHVTPEGVQLQEVVEVAKDFHPAAEAWLVYDGDEDLVISLY